MSNDGRHEQNHNKSREQPDRSYDERARQRQVNAADGHQSKQRLPARLGFIEMIMRTGHTVVYSKD